MFTHIVVHYGEIGTKGKNRPFFEKKLLDNIRSSIKKSGVKEIKRRYGRIVIELEDKPDIKTIEEKLKDVPGIAFFSLALRCDLNVEDLKETTLKLAKKYKGSFKISARRSNKQFKLQSPEINKQIGAYIEENTGNRVDYENPENQFYIEVTEKDVFVFKDKIKGVGGLPVGVSGKLIVLMSGGIDSPVSAYLGMKRGCSVSLVHFYNSTLVKEAVREKILELANKLSKYQFKTKLYLIPFEKLQNELIKKIPSKYRMVVYRRFMFRIAENIFEEEKALGFVTGDNLGQVASQTLENLDVIYNVTDKLILSPLMGFDKQEIVNLAKEIGTYETSIKPYEDCCSFMIAEHPETKCDIKEIEKLEKFDYSNLVEDALTQKEVRIFMEK